MLILGATAASASGFEGRIDVLSTRNGEVTSLRYTLGVDFLRIEVSGSTTPTPIDLVDRKSGVLTILFPHNQTFVRLRPSGRNRPGPGGAPTPPVPSGSLPPGIGPHSDVPNLPPVPMPMRTTEKIELKPTGKKDKILGYVCEQFEIKSSGETMEIWATDGLPSLPPYLRNQRTPFGPRQLEEQWAELVSEKKLCPLRAVLLGENSTERFHFEVKSLTPEKLPDKDGKLFQPPKDYTEVEPLPF